MRLKIRPPVRLILEVLVAILDEGDVEAPFPVIPAKAGIHGLIYPSQTASCEALRQTSGTARSPSQKAHTFPHPCAEFHNLGKEVSRCVA